jgi:hypothetical protein
MVIYQQMIRACIPRDMILNRNEKNSGPAFRIMANPTCGLCRADCFQSPQKRSNRPMFQFHLHRARTDFR